MIGWIRVERKTWDHHIFDKEPMSQREAWLWMVQNAAYEDTHHKVGSSILDVPRGSFMETLRGLRDAFTWGSDTKVRNFLSLLESQGMIKRTVVGSRNAPKTHVTICNYSKYQDLERTENAPKTHRAIPKNAVKKQDNNITTDTNVSVSDPPPAIDGVSEAVLRFNRLAERVGLPCVQKLNPTRRKLLKARLADVGGLDGWNFVLAKVEASPFLMGKTSRPFQCNFDFVVKQANFTKIMEGNYDERPAQENFADVGKARSSGYGIGREQAQAFGEVAARLSGVSL